MSWPARSLYSDRALARFGVGHPVLTNSNVQFEPGFRRYRVFVARQPGWPAFAGHDRYFFTRCVPEFFAGGAVKKNRDRKSPSDPCLLISDFCLRYVFQVDRTDAGCNVETGVAF